ncbi:hypothetical protein RRG08_019422 [Elysia crispata]|uniref:Uncharacterized protein n=1 Tax=Elysia crispata TaxID=231223 RepID=A0AAE0Z534_9GAST|nr:hypothetical protein RRG08_019422 [Elysia crispata]
MRKPHLDKDDPTLMADGGPPPPPSSSQCDTAWDLGEIKLRTFSELPPSMHCKSPDKHKTCKTRALQTQSQKLTPASSHIPGYRVSRGEMVGRAFLLEWS